MSLNFPLADLNPDVCTLINCGGLKNGAKWRLILWCENIMDNWSSVGEGSKAMIKVGKRHLEQHLISFYT